MKARPGHLALFQQIAIQTTFMDMLLDDLCNTVTVDHFLMPLHLNLNLVFH